LNSFTDFVQQYRILRYHIGRPTSVLIENKMNLSECFRIASDIGLTQVKFLFDIQQLVLIVVSYFS